MGGIGGLEATSLRGKLSAGAFAGLITTAIMSGLVLLTAWTASDVANAARVAHDRMRIYTQLNTAAREYQSSAYAAVRDTSPAAQGALTSARSELARLLGETAQLQAYNDRDHRISRIIVRQGAVVLERFRDTPRHVQRVDVIWQHSGSRAAMAEVNRISAPVYAMERTLLAEIHNLDGQVSLATSRAADLSRLAVGAALFGLLLAMAFSLRVQLLLHTRLRPGLTRLEQGAQAFGAGQLDHRIGLDGSDELTRLSTAFDAMAGTIAEKQAALREIQLDLERAVASRTEELQEANARLSEADGRRRAFLADVSHELRTPLTVIRGETQVALRTADQPGFDPHDVFERILQQTRDLSRMVDDLFLIARAEAGGLPLNRQRLDLREMATRVAGDFETLAMETGSSIRADGARGVVAFVDPDRLRRALAALIENALRHCQPGVVIDIDVQEIGGQAVIAVADDGPGIDPAIAVELFQRFRRGETRGEGSGLGLSLVGALVEAHGGVAFLSPRAGGGTRAVIELPLAEQALAAA